MSLILNITMKVLIEMIDHLIYFNTPIWPHIKDPGPN